MSVCTTLRAGADMGSSSALVIRLSHARTRVMKPRWAARLRRMILRLRPTHKPPRLISAERASRPSMPGASALRLRSLEGTDGNEVEKGLLVRRHEPVSRNVVLTRPTPPVGDLL